jgi:hypothetical protein
MRRTLRGLGLAAVLAAGGCGPRPAATPTPRPTGPLAVADWHALPAAQKYAPETLERLKEGDPKLQTQRGWDAFYANVLRPSREKDQAAAQPKR